MFKTYTWYRFTFDGWLNSCQRICVNRLVNRNTGDIDVRIERREIQVVVSKFKILKIIKSLVF